MGGLRGQPVREVELPSPMCVAELEQPGLVHLPAQECEPTEALELDRDHQVPGGCCVAYWVKPGTPKVARGSIYVDTEVLQLDTLHAGWVMWHNLHTLTEPYTSAYIDGALRGSSACTWTPQM
jgi:hypothetical protein